MQLQGKIIQVLELRSGVGKTSGKEWRSLEFVVETNDNYPKKICFSLFGDKIDTFGRLLAPGNDVLVSFDVSSREINGRWFTSVDAWKIEQAQAAPQPPQPPYQAPQQAYAAPQPPAPPAPPAIGDDLPF